MIIGISGKRGSGKNTLAELIRKRRPEYQIRAYADKLKQIVAILTGLPIEDMYSEEGKARYLDDWGMTVGQIQQRIGTEVVRAINPNAWIIALFADYTPDQLWAVTDVRFLNEVAAIQDRDGIVVRAEREQRGDDGRNSDHLSETALDGYEDWDLVIDNNGTLEELESAALRVLDVARAREVKKHSESAMIELIAKALAYWGSLWVQLFGWPGGADLLFLAGDLRDDV